MVSAIGDATSTGESQNSWILFVGSDAEALARAAEPELAPPVVSLPEPVSVAAHELSPPHLAGPRTLYLPRLDRALRDKMGCATTSLYLLPKLAQLASEGQPLGVIATAIESRAADLVARRGLASRFQIRRVPGTRPTDDEAPALVVQEQHSLGQVFLAVSLLEKRELGGAIAALKRAIALEPDLPAAHYELGKALIQKDDLHGAIAAFRETTRLLPEFASAWGNLGAALGEAQELDSAAEALRRAVELDPLSHALHSNLGVAYRDQRRLDEAEAEFLKALALAPDFVFGHYNLARVQFLQGRYGEAIESFEQAQSLSPAGSPRQRLLLAVTRLASGDVEGAFVDYRNVFERLEGQMKLEMRTVAEWDLKELALRVGVTPSLKEAAALLQSLV